MKNITKSKCCYLTKPRLKSRNFQKSSSIANSTCSTLLLRHGRCKLWLEAAEVEQNTDTHTHNILMHGFPFSLDLRYTPLPLALYRHLLAQLTFPQSL